MPIFSLENKKQVLFVHIPKNGGTSIECSFQTICKPKLLTPGPPRFLKCSPQHLTLSDLQVLGFQPQDFDYSFAIVRNPYKRIESEYFFSIHVRTRSIDFSESLISPLDPKAKEEVEDFSAWAVRNMNSYKMNRNHADNHFIPQSEFIDDTVEDIYFFEDGMESILEKISKKIGITLPNEHRFKTDKFPLVWSKEATELANQIYKVDLEKYGYQSL